MAEQQATNATSEDSNIDSELCDLLDNALLDFGKAPPVSTKNKPKSDSVSKPKCDTVSESASKNTETKTQSNVSDIPLFPDPSSVDCDEIMKKLMSQLEDSFQSVLADGAVKPEDIGDDAENFSCLEQQFLNVLKEMTEDTSNPTSEASCTPNNTEFSSVIAETLKNLSEDSDLLHRPKGKFNSSGDDQTENSESDEVSFISNIMQMFLSKEMLYPSIKELTMNFPGWLETNKSSISREDYDRYLKQLEIMNKICSVYESTPDPVNEETKTQQFTTVFELMEKMKDYGHPPNELIGSFNIPL